MKKILLLCVVIFTAIAGNAQSVQVWKHGKLIAEFFDRDELEFIFSNTISGHEYVEIGGKKWATMNLGATTVAGSGETCYGDYYQWGSVNTLYNTKTWNNAPSTWNFTWKSGKDNGFADTNREYTGNDNVLPAVYDVVKKEWGGRWRMPTLEDFLALYEACTGTRIDAAPTVLNTSTPSGGVYYLASNQKYLSDYTGVAGILFVDCTDTSKRVFFPAAGYYEGNSYHFDYGDYWSSSLAYTDTAHHLHFNYANINHSHVYRYYGLSVRPVAD